MTSPSTLEAWTGLLRAVSRPAVPQEFFMHLRELGREDCDAGVGPDGLSAAVAPALGWVDGFSDNAGHRRDVDRPFLCQLLSYIPAGECPRGASPLARAWWALYHADALGPLGIDFAGEGPLLPAMRELGIETWTETELGVMHALLWRGTTGRNKPILERAFRACAWALDNLQPDNATNHPWGIHAFIVMAINPDLSRDQRAAADLYAQALVHNAIVHEGRPDRFSALLLWDSAAWLESVPRLPWQRAPESLRHVSHAARDYTPPTP